MAQDSLIVTIEMGFTLTGDYQLPDSVAMVDRQVLSTALIF